MVVGTFTSTLESLSANQNTWPSHCCSLIKIRAKGDKYQNLSKEHKGPKGLGRALLPLAQHHFH